jgi:hypothetical protein
MVIKMINNLIHFLGYIKKLRDFILFFYNFFAIILVCKEMRNKIK